MKDRNNVPDNTNSAITRPFDQGYSVPPNCKARTRQTREAVMTTILGIPNLFILSAQERCDCFLGASKMKQIMPMAIAAIGKLIPKHHLHVAVSVNAPPIKGAVMDAIPVDPNISPLGAPLFSRGTEAARTRIEPEKIPAAPDPAMALPRIRAIEFGATVQTSEPILNSTRART